MCLRTREKEGGIIDADRKRVLVIDDDAAVRGVIQALLESEGFEVAVATDGRAGLESQRSNPAAVVVTDIFMPGQDGIETVFDLHREFPRTGIIVLSGGAPQMALDYLQVAAQLGAVMTMKKPFQSQQLVNAVHALSSAA